jgi:CHAT domain-containing protein
VEGVESPREARDRRDMDRFLIPMLRYYGLGLIVSSLLTSGFLAGKFNRENLFRRINCNSGFGILPLDDEKGFALLGQLRRFPHLSVAQEALAYLLAKFMGLVRRSCLPIAAVTALMYAPLTGQTRTSESNPKRLTEKADRLAWLYNWYLAGPLYAEAEKLYEQAGDSRNALYAKIGRLRFEWETLSFPEVSEYLATELDSPLAQNDPKLRLWILDAKGAIDLEVNVASARQAYEEAREIARQLGDKAREARASGELGIISFMEGGTGDSIALLSDALRASIELKDVGAHIRYLNLMGNGLTLFGRPEDAIRYFDRALQLVRSTPELDTSTMAVSGKARALIAMNKTVEAEKLFQETLDRARLRNHHGLAASILSELGKTASDAGKRTKAVAYYEEAATLAEGSELHRQVATAMFGLAKIYRDAGDLEKAEELAAKGVEASQKVGETYEMPKRLALLARLRSDRGKFGDADRLYEQAEDVVDGLLVSVASPSARTSLIGAMSQIYVDHFALAVDSLKDPARAFEVLEQARGRTAADVLRNREQAVTVSSRVRTAYEREIARLQIRLMRASSRDERRQVLEKLFDEEQGLSGRKLRQMPRLMGQGQPVTLATLVQTLRPDELILEYALGEPRSYCLVIDNKGIRAVPLPDAGHIEARVDAYLAQLRARRRSTQSAKELYSMLLGSITEVLQKGRLIVVPDGKLHLLPFDALVDDQDEYVLAKHVVTYVPSVTVLHLLKVQPETSTTNLPLLAVGDVPYGDGGNLVSSTSAHGKATPPGTTRGLYDLRGERLPPLPGTAEEVQSIAEIVGARSVVLMGRTATEARFRSEPLEKVRVLHLAVHGISSTTSPDRAALVLGRGANDEDDGLLQAREIAELNLSAELVTLSACDTGVGRLVGQEGIVNLVRAFLFAGARSIVASLWAADDAFTTSLMKRFYSNLARGMDRGSALQKAKLGLVGQFGDQAVPFFWAGFTMIGDGSRGISFSE